MTQKHNYKEILNKINTFVFDVDGVMTDGKLSVLPSGEYIRNYNVKDGYSMNLAIKEGFRILVITGGKEESIKIRMEKIGIQKQDVVLLASEKLDKLTDFINMYNLKAEEILYMGDDIPDIEPMAYCGIAACPSDAATDVKVIASYISPLKGGQGCVRDVIEQVLKSQGKWAMFNDATMGV